MWDTAVRIPVDACLLTGGSEPDGRDRLLTLIGSVPGITVDELHALGLPGLFAHLRALPRDGVNTRPPAGAPFSHRATKVFARDDSAR